MMILFGIVPLIVSRALMFPMSSDYPPFLGNPLLIAMCEAEGYDTSNISKEVENP